jgi:membrane-associated PAP2 superfamily phosphatase
MLDLLRASSRRLAEPLAASALLVLAATVVFLAYPGIDLWFSGLFYESESGFALASHPALLALRRSGEIALIAISAAVIASVALKVVRPDRPSLTPPRASLFLTLTLLLGPGLLVNLILKNNWGRPRPVQIEAFGGDAPFVGIWQITDHCASNCSFVSGEASSAIWIMSLALVVPPCWRLFTFAVTGVYALALSFNRIAFGGHFLSDVVLSWGLTLAIVALVYRLLYVNPPAALSDASLEAGLARIGEALRRILPGRRA